MRGKSVPQRCGLTRRSAARLFPEHELVLHSLLCTALSIGRSGPRFLDGQNLGLIDRWRFDEELFSLGEERLRDLARKMRVAPALIGERSEDAESGRAGPHRVPND